VNRTARTIIRYLLLVLAGMISAPLMDIGSIVWMNLLPADLDLTANYFLMVVLPVALIVHFVAALVLWKAFEPAPKPAAATYLGTHIATQIFWLANFGNPVTDIAAFSVVLLASGSGVLYVFNRYFWCPACIEPA